VARVIITLVLAFVLVGLLWPVLVRLRRGRVSDDVIIRRERRSYFVPIAACVAVTFLISAALWWWLGQ
jgi:predicted PurR-regulated permease PerM